MGAEFRKVMFGYNTEEVDKRISAIEEEIAKNMESAETALKNAINENKELIEKLDQINKEKAEYEEFRLKIADMLLKAFIDASEEVYNFKTQADATIEEKTEKLHELKMKNSEINTSIEKLLEKLENIQSN